MPAPSPAALVLPPPSDELPAGSKPKGEGLFGLFNRRPKEAPAEKPVTMPTQPAAAPKLATVAAASDVDGGVTEPALRADPPVANPVRTTGSAGGWSAKARGELKAKKAQAGEEAYLESKLVRLGVVTTPSAHHVRVVVAARPLHATPGCFT